MNNVALVFCAAGGFPKGLSQVMVFNNATQMHGMLKEKNMKLVAENWTTTLEHGEHSYRVIVHEDVKVVK